MVTYNDTRFTYNGDYTYNGVQLSNISENQNTSDINKDNIYGFNFDTSQSIDNILLYILKIISVSEISTSSDVNINNIYFTDYDNSISVENKLINIFSNNIDYSVQTENINTIRFLLISISDISSSSENKILNLDYYTIDNQSTLENIVSTINFDKTETVNSSDIKNINILLKNIDIIYTTENVKSLRLLLNRIKPGIIGIDKIIPKLIKATKSKPSAQ